jgi:hypothetical protein
MSDLCRSAYSFMACTLTFSTTFANLVGDAVRRGEDIVGDAAVDRDMGPKGNRDGGQTTKAMYSQSSTVRHLKSRLLFFLVSVGANTDSSPRPLHTHRLTQPRTDTHRHAQTRTDTDLSCEGPRATRDGSCLSFEWGANSNGNVMRHTAPSEQRHRRVTVRHRYLHGRLACAKCLQEREDVLGVDWAVPARARVSVRRKCAACKVETHHAKR